MFRPILIAAPFALLVGCGGGAAPPSEEVEGIPVRLAIPELRRGLPPIVLTGTLGAKEEIPLAFKAGGVVSRVTADVGQRVVEGEVLAELSLIEIDAQVSAAHEGRNKARRDLTRAEALFVDSVVTKAQVEDARTQLDVAEAQLRAAEFNRQYAVVRAPTDGIVLRRTLEAGQVVGPGTPVLVLRSERRGFVLRAAAADLDAVRLTVGAEATVTFDAFPGDQFGARIEQVGVAASPQTGTYVVELAVSPGRRRFVSGLIGRATLHPRAEVPLQLIPAEALLEVDGAWATVFVLADTGDVVRRTKVRVAYLDGAMVAIAGGLPDSARVVTAGATRLTDGVRVTVTPERVP